MSNPPGEPDVRRRRRRIELALRYQELFLAAMGFYAKPRDEASWRGYASEIRERPFSENALGLASLYRASILDRLRALQGDARSFSGAENDDFIGRAIEEVVRKIDRHLAGRPQSISWSTAFEEHVSALRQDVEARLEEFVPGKQRHLVVSDVHLGVAAGNGDAFRDVLDVCEQGDQLILLGDILDFWIHLEKDENLEDVVVAHWRQLYRQLRHLRERGVAVHYVPGNHDMFVFLFEAYGHLDWCGSVMTRCPQLLRMHQALADHRLAAVCEIRYPFLKLATGGPSVLYTHGHAHELAWHFLTGNPYEDGVFLTFLETAATVLAYRFARELRGLFNLVQGPIDWVRHATDIALVITNRHLTEYAKRNPRLDTLEQRGQFVDSLVTEFERLSSSAEGSEIKAIEAARAYDRLQQWHRAPAASVRAATQRYLDDHRSELNFHLWSPARSQIAMSTSRMQDYRTFDQFVFGHYHQPRDQAPDHDGGCLLRPGPTSCLMITPQGRILRPAGIF